MPNPTEDRAIREAERRAALNMLDRSHLASADRYEELKRWVDDRYPPPEPEWVESRGASGSKVRFRYHPHLDVEYLSGESWERLPAKSAESYQAIHDAIAQAKANAERDA